MAAHLWTELVPANSLEAMGKSATTIALCISRSAEAIAADDTLRNSFPVAIAAEAIAAEAIAASGTLRR